MSGSIQERRAECELLPNLSAIAVAGQYLWTASAETRSIECLAPAGHGYELIQQFALDTLCPGVPSGRRPRSRHRGTRCRQRSPVAHRFTLFDTTRAKSTPATFRSSPGYARSSRRLLGSLPDAVRMAHLPCTNGSRAAAPASRKCNSSATCLPGSITQSARCHAAISTDC
jgi:hypothetical protein